MIEKVLIVVGVLIVVFVVFVAILASRPLSQDNRDEHATITPTTKTTVPKNFGTDNNDNPPTP
jgi:hypothetical protein